MHCHRMVLPSIAAARYTGSLCPTAPLCPPVPLISVAVHTPAHSAINAASELLTYRADTVPPAGSLVRVPLGKREVLSS